MAKISPSQNTLKKLKEDGWIPWVVEQPWNQYTKVRKDLYGFIDILAVGGEGTLAVQATSKANISTRIKKIESDELSDKLAAVRKAGWRIEVWGWFQERKGGKWYVKIVDVS